MVSFKNYKNDQENRSHDLTATRQGKVRLKNGRASIDMGTMEKPGFLDLRLTVEGDQTTPPAAPLLLRRGIRYQHHVKVGFSP